MNKERRKRIEELSITLKKISVKLSVEDFKYLKARWYDLADSTDDLLNRAKNREDVLPREVKMLEERLEKQFRIWDALDTASKKL